MIAVSAVMMACAVNAASYIWGFNSAETVAPDGAYFGEGSYSDATAMLFLGTVTAGADGWEGLSSATLLASGNMNGDPDYNWGQFDTDTMPSSDLVNALGGQAYTLILLDSGSVSDLASYEGKYVSVTGTSDGFSIPGAGETVYYAAFTTDTVFGASDWADTPAPGPTPPVIPEPTTGLLVLLGVAGLALRCRA